MNYRPEEADPIMQPRKQLYLGFLNSVGSRLGRDIDYTERLALAFLVDKKWAPVEDAESYMRVRLGIMPEDNQSLIAWKLHNGIYQAQVDYLQQLQLQSGQDEEGIKKLQVIRGLIELGHEDTQKAHIAGLQIPLGGVPPSWLPDWAKTL